jgi:hypothetical protein
LGQRVKLVSSVFTALEGETSVVEIPRKRDIDNAAAPRDVK